MGILDSRRVQVAVAISFLLTSLLTVAGTVEAHTAWAPRAPMIPSDPVVYDSAPNMSSPGLSHAVVTWDSATGGKVDPVIGSYGDHEVMVDELNLEIPQWAITRYWQNGTECGYCSYTDYAIIQLDLDDHPLTATQTRWLLTHEFGHVWGMIHATDNSYLMYGSYNGVTSPTSHELSHMGEEYP